MVMRKQIPYRKVAGRLVLFTDELDDWMDRSPGLPLEVSFHWSRSSAMMLVFSKMTESAHFKVIAVYALILTLFIFKKLFKG